MTICVPGLDEQTHIAACLTSLDSVLTAEIQKRASLKLHKRGLMQPFPSPEEAVA